MPLLTSDLTGEGKAVAIVYGNHLGLVLVAISKIVLLLIQMKVRSLS